MVPEKQNLAVIELRRLDDEIVGRQRQRVAHQLLADELAAKDRRALIEVCVRGHEACAAQEPGAALRVEGPGIREELTRKITLAR
mgnify:CR=1 FL=1